MILKILLMQKMSPKMALFFLLKKNILTPSLPTAIWVNVESTDTHVFVYHWRMIGPAAQTYSIWFT